MANLFKKVVGWSNRAKDGSKRTREKKKFHKKEREVWAVVVVVKWSACSPSTQTIHVRIPLKSTIFE